MSAALEILEDPPALREAAGELVVAAARDAIDERGSFVLALAGGSTPRGLYEHLASPAMAGRIDWTRTVVLFGDERCVSPTDPQSNYRMAADSLLGPLGIEEHQVHRLRGEDDPRAEADRYAGELAELLGGTRDDPRGPARPLDLVLLGLGANAHTASLFPGLRWSALPDRWVLAEYVEVVASWRLTLGPAVLGAAAQVCFLVSGASKAAAVASVLEGPRDPLVRPAQLFSSLPSTRWLLDAEAGGQLAGQR